MTDSCELCCRLFLPLLGVIGLTFSILTLASCDYFEFENGQADFVPGGIGDGTIGLFRADLDGDCESYPDDADFDGYMIAARALSILATLVGSFGLALLIFECVLCKCCGSMMAIHFTFFVAWSCQGLSFIIFATEDLCLEKLAECDLGNGGIYSIVAISVWIITSCAVCCSREPEPLVKGGCCTKSEKKDEEEPTRTQDKELKEEEAAGVKEEAIPEEGEPEQAIDS